MERIINSNKRPAKKRIYLAKHQLQRLVEYQGEDNLWNISSADYHKRDERIKGNFEEEKTGKFVVKVFFI